MSPGLQHLILHRCGIRDVGGVAITTALRHASAAPLQTLDLSNNPIGPKTAVTIAALLVRAPKFSSFLLCPLTLLALSQETSTCKLSRISLDASGITSAGGVAVAKALTHNRRMRVCAPVGVFVVQVPVTTPA